jgi:hypothetical protein
MHAHFAPLAKDNLIREFAFATRADATQRVLHGAAFNERIAHICPSELTAFELYVILFTFFTQAFHAPSTTTPAFFVRRGIAQRALRFGACLRFGWQRPRDFIKQLRE